MLKMQQSKSFAMKDTGAAKQILGVRIIQDRKEKKFWLSQEHNIRRVLQRFHMENAKAMNTPHATHFKLSGKLGPLNEVEKTYRRKVPYAFAVGSFVYTMVCIRPNIAHAFGTIS